MGALELKDLNDAIKFLIDCGKSSGAAIFRQDMERLKIMLQARDSKIQRLQNRVDALTQDNEKLKADNAKIDDLRQRLGLLANENQVYLWQKDKLSGENQNLRRENIELAAALQTAKARIAELERRDKDLRFEMDKSFWRRMFWRLFRNRYVTCI